jgi:hypothetical protein
MRIMSGIASLLTNGFDHVLSTLANPFHWILKYDLQWVSIVTPFSWIWPPSLILMKAQEQGLPLVHYTKNGILWLTLYDYKWHKWLKLT